MSHYDNLIETFSVDAGHHAVDPIGDGGGGELAGFFTVTGQVDRQHPQCGFLAAQFSDGEVPAVRGMFAAVNEHEGGQRHAHRVPTAGTSALWDVPRFTRRARRSVVRWSQPV